MAVKVNFTFPENVIELLKQNVRERERSSFVAEAVREKLASVERARLEQELIEGYQVTAEEDAAINAEWEAITMESWPEDDDDEAI